MATKDLFMQFRYLTLVFLMVFSCSEDQEIQPQDDVEDEQQETIENPYAGINQWILENMNLYYLWNDEIPEELDLTSEPTEFFESILYTYDDIQNPEGDRFSFMSEDADALLAEFSGESKSFGMEFRLFYMTALGNEIVAQIIYVLEDSPADLAGLERGSMFTYVNGMELNDENYYELLFSNDNMTINSVSYENEQFVDLGFSYEMTSTTLQENPIFLDSIYNINGINVGYLLYNQFIPGPNGSSVDEYDLQLEEIFGEFKSEGVSELIVDLRYNPGGYVSSAITLASHIGTGANSKQLFYREEYNTDFQNYLTNAYGADYLNVNFEDKASNIGDQINGVYFLVSNYSASSSELVINGLKPYMNVILIGEQTYGKNVGSFTISSEDLFDVNWAIQPIVVKSYNSLGQSDYTAGFLPDIEAYESLELVPFGDISDPLLGRAIGMLSGVARITAPEDFIKPRILEVSVHHKPVTNKHITVLPED